MSTNQIISKKLLVNFQQKKIYNTKEVSEFVDHSKAQLEIIPSDNSLSNLNTDLNLFKEIFELMLNKLDKKQNKNKLKKKFKESITDIKKVRKQAQIPHRMVKEVPEPVKRFDDHNNIGNGHIFDQNNERLEDTKSEEESI